MTYPEKTSILPVVADDKMAEAGQSPSPVVGGSTVTAHDEEDRVPSVTPPTLLVVSNNNMEKEGQSPSPAVDGPIVIADDKEDGETHARRVVAALGPTEGGEGTVWRVGGQPPFTPPELQGPWGPNPNTPFLPSDAPIALLLASHLAQIYSR